MRIPIQILILLATAAIATAAAPAPRPPVQILDNMIKNLRSLQSSMQKEAQTPSGQWQDILAKQIEPIALSVGELSRTGVHSSAPTSAYGLRVLCNTLRTSRDPKHAVQTAESLVQTISFLRAEHQLAAQRQAPPPLPEVSRTKARDTALEILKRSEFRQSTKPHFFEHYLNRMIVKVIAWLQGIFDSAAMKQAGTFAYLFLWLVYLVVGFLVIWLVYRTWVPRRRVDETQTPEPTGGIVLLTPETHLAAAEEFCRQGNHAAAVREYFLMMLATLEQRNLVARNRSWTNWEYLRAFGKRVREEAARGQMSQLNLVYDQVSYGGLTCDAQRYTAFRKNVDDFLSALPSSPA